MAKILKKRILPFDGKVLVNKGDIVKPETLVAEMFYIGERPFIVNIADRLKVELTEIEGYLTKKVGDTVQVGEIIAERKTLGARMLADSPVSGILEYISPASGGVIIREKVGKDELGPVTINCANALDIPPERLEINLNKHKGERVEKGGILASISLYAGIIMKYCKSPIYGEVVDVDLKRGNVVVKRPVEERKLNASIPGIIKEVIPKRGVVIETDAEVFYGVFGFGGEKWGTLGKDIIIFDEPIKRKEFESLRGKIKGIITPSISVMEFDDIFGDEIRKGITKENETRITVILMEGFGRLKLDKGIKKKLNKYIGRLVTIDGRTQIRAGVRRPEITIPTM